MQDVLARHIERFNEGVRTGNWEAMLAGFTDDAELIFRGVPVGPFVGRVAISAAYADQPPDDEITTIQVIDGDADTILARYGWERDRACTSGSMRLDRRNDLIQRLVVAFDPERA